MNVIIDVLKEIKHVDELSYNVERLKIMKLIVKRKTRIEQKLSVIRRELSKEFYDWYVDNYIQLSRDLWSYMSRGLISTKMRQTYTNRIREKLLEECKRLEDKPYNQSKPPWTGLNFVLHLSAVVVQYQRPIAPRLSIGKTCRGGENNRQVYEFQMVEEYLCEECADAKGYNMVGKRVALRTEPAERFMQDILFNRAYWCGKCKIKKLFIIKDECKPIKI
jgi:hypothetical protein